MQTAATLLTADSLFCGLCRLAASSRTGAAPSLCTESAIRVTLQVAVTNPALLLHSDSSTEKNLEMGYAVPLPCSEKRGRRMEKKGYGTVLECGTYYGVVEGRKKRKGCACCVNSLTRVLECHLFHALPLTSSGLGLPEFRRSFHACPASLIDEFAQIKPVSPIEFLKKKMKK